VLEATARPVYIPEEVTTTTVYGIENGRWGVLGHPKPIRKLGSVFLATGQVESIVEDIQGFMDSKDWYEERCIPHHRGYLLYGPAGIMIY